MKINVKKYSNSFSLILSILFIILGAVMYTNPKEMVIFTTYIFGGLLIVIGIFKCVKNYLDVKKDNNTPSTAMISGIVFTIIGIIFIFLAGLVEAFVRLIIGGWILFAGINHLLNISYMNKKSSKFWASIILACLLIGIGLYTILQANLAFQILGIILMIYAVLEIIGYIFNRRETIVIKKEKIIDAQIVEQKQITSNKKKDSKKKN